ncbi:MAG: aminomethyl-transferring glycine dehydrogenase subunit GcvPB [bacterium]|nr:aminomethyl-transferring glycine dehydrogenase subunit GcvPB [bacterium]
MERYDLTQYPVDKLSFELSRPGRKAYTLPDLDVPQVDIPKEYQRQSIPRLPELSEPEVMRHFTNLSTLNYHIERGFYPLGSCTMKYNPKVNEYIARLPGFTELHPLQPESTVQGSLELIYELERLLTEISGMDNVSLQPVAGAHSELASLLIVRKYFNKRGENRNKILIPDSAHGTNPASSVLTGFEPISIKSNEYGLVDLNTLCKAMGTDVACLMLTIPNTLGLFESQIDEIAKIVHENGGLLYLDGANLNAFLGITKPSDMGFDIMHFNLHKTFGTPHGTGGPGGGGIGVKGFLEPFLPVPRVEKIKNEYKLSYDFPDSIGRVHSFYGNFGVCVKAYAYIKMLGANGLKGVAENAVINANYLMTVLKEYYELPYPGPCMHEFVLSGDKQKALGIKTLDIAKRLLDYGFHPPTIYFPLIVHEALMIEPTETESIETLDSFIDAMIKIDKEARENPDILRSAPHNTPVRRLDEVKAARELDVKFYS